MRVVFLVITLVAGMLAATPVWAHVTPPNVPSPFAVSAVPNAELASARGTAGPQFRMGDDFSAAFMRQTASIPGEIRDVWTFEIAVPLIAANIMASGER